MEKCPKKLGNKAKFLCKSAGVISYAPRNLFNSIVPRNF